MNERNLSIILNQLLQDNVTFALAIRIAARVIPRPRASDSVRITPTCAFRMDTMPDGRQTLLCRPDRQVVQSCRVARDLPASVTSASFSSPLRGPGLYLQTP